MFDLINGLPIHPLVVHVIVVLLPLSVLGTIAIAIVPRWRRRYGHLVVAVMAFVTVMIPVATSSGEALARRVGDPGRHARLGDQLIWFALPLLALDVALVLSARYGDRIGARRAVAVRAVAIVSVVAALAAGVQVYRVGDAGARAAWGDQVTSPRGG